MNLPAAALVIIILRYLSLDFEMRRKAAAYNNKPSSTNIIFQRKPLDGPKVLIEKSDWRRKVNSPVVEDAIDQFTRHIVSEWVTDLWYSRITPDKQAPEELVQIINSVLGEVSSRIKNINLIDLLTRFLFHRYISCPLTLRFIYLFTSVPSMKFICLGCCRDIVNLLCTHLELFRASQAKIVKLQLESLTIEQRDTELKSVLAAENKLHPVLFSAESEHKVFFFPYIFDIQ